MNKVAAFALRRKNSILSMSEKMFCPPQPLRFWITPACAGKSCAEQARRFHLRDHPHMCGESPAIMVCSLEYWGSPPRVWGKGHRNSQSDYQRGITPACAGKRARPSPCRSQSRDHPRACGEKRVGSLASVGLSGSPPRVRGKACRCPPLDTNQRVTPACAGKSAGTGSRSGASWDHPRLCGEKPVTVRCIFLNLGSPPRVRGKDPETTPPSPVQGITPAHAGKSGCRWCSRSRSKDHPRACGEKLVRRSISVCW